jgi:hypothetical protein
MLSDFRSSLHPHLFVRCGQRTRALAACAAALLLLASTASAAPRALAAAFTAVTTSMTPADVGLRIQIFGWSDADARANVVAALADDVGAAKALGQLPTVGYVWPASGPAGYSVKYAHRAEQENGGERVTLVMDRRLGSYDYKGWSVSGATAKETAYSVLELNLDESGNGVGTLSLAADVVIDEEANTVSLATSGTTVNVLKDVKRAP